MRGKLLRVSLVVSGVVALGAGAAFATGAIESMVGADGVIDGCYKGENGQLRVLGDGGECNASELPISWSQTGPKGDQGPPGEPSRAYRVSRFTPDEVEITAVGAGPIGFDFPNGGPTTIFTMTLPEGVYVVDSSVAARKDSGSSDFICWVAGPTVSSNITRTSLGADAGHARRATVASNGIFGLPVGGGTLTLACWQASNPGVPGSPSGENPTAFYSTLTATKVTRATYTRFPSGPVTELP